MCYLACTSGCNFMGGCRMQDEDCGPTCQSHRTDRLHPLLQSTKHHLSFLASAHATSPNTFFSEIRFHPACVRSCRIYDAIPIWQPNTPEASEYHRIAYQYPYPRTPHRFELCKQTNKNGWKFDFTGSASDLTCYLLITKNHHMTPH